MAERLDQDLLRLIPHETPKQDGWRAGWLGLRCRHPHRHRARRAFWYRGFEAGLAARERFLVIRAGKAAQRGHGLARSA